MRDKIACACPIRLRVDIYRLYCFFTSLAAKNGQCYSDKSIHTFQNILWPFADVISLISTLGQAVEYMAMIQF